MSGWRVCLFLIIIAVTAPSIRPADDIKEVEQRSRQLTEELLKFVNEPEPEKTSTNIEKEKESNSQVTDGQLSEDEKGNEVQNKLSKRELLGNDKTHESGTINTIKRDEHESDNKSTENKSSDLNQSQNIYKDLSENESSKKDVGGIKDKESNCQNCEKKFNENTPEEDKSPLSSKTPSTDEVLSGNSISTTKFASSTTSSKPSTICLNELQVKSFCLEHSMTKEVSEKQHTSKINIETTTPRITDIISPMVNEVSKTQSTTRTNIETNTPRTTDIISPMVIETSTTQQTTKTNIETTTHKTTNILCHMVNKVLNNQHTSKTNTETTTPRICNTTRPMLNEVSTNQHSTKMNPETTTLRNTHITSHAETTRTTTPKSPKTSCRSGTKFFAHIVVMSSPFPKGDNLRATTPALHRGERDVNNDGKKGKTMDKSRVRRQDDADHKANVERQLALLLGREAPTKEGEEKWRNTEDEVTPESSDRRSASSFRKDSANHGAKRPWLRDSDEDHVLLVPKAPEAWPSPSPTEQQHPVGTQWKGNSLTMLQKMEQQLQKERAETLKQDAEDARRKNEEQEKVVLMGEGVKHKSNENINRFEEEDDDSRVTTRKSHGNNNSPFVERVVLDIVPGPHGQLIANSAVIMHHTVSQQPNLQQKLLYDNIRTASRNDPKSKLIPRCSVALSRDAYPKCIYENPPVAIEKSDLNRYSEDDVPITHGSPDSFREGSPVTNDGSIGFTIIAPATHSPYEDSTSDEDTLSDSVTKVPLGTAAHYRPNDSSGKPEDRDDSDNDATESDVPEIKTERLALTASPLPVAVAGGSESAESEVTDGAFATKVRRGESNLASTRKWRTVLPSSLLILPDDRSQLPEGIRRRSSRY